MENEEIEKLNIASKIKLGSTGIKNTATISSVDNLKITKVLTASAKPVVENVSILNAEVKFDGNIEYDLLVVLENNEMVPLTQKSSFSQVFENSAITPDSLVVISSNLLECNNISNTGDITYSTLTNFDVFKVSVNSDLSCASHDDNVFVKESEVSYSSFLGDISYSANVNFELPKDNKIEKILFATNNAYIKSVMPATDYFVASGEVISCIVYLGEDGQVKSCTKETSFSEEIEYKGVTKDSNIHARVLTKEAVIVENTDKNVFVIDVPIVICAQIYNKFTKTCVVDAYSLLNEVNLTTTSFQDSDFVSTRSVEENILTNFQLTDNMQPIDKILSIVPINISIANQIVKDGEILLEGIATINIIYYFEDDEGNNILNSIDVEVPYSLSLNAPDVNENDFVSSSIILGDISIKNKRGMELEILAEAKIDYDFVKVAVSAITTEINIGDEKLPKDYALELFLAKEGQTLWDIAKELNISSTDLVNQNGNLTLPIKEGEKIVAYNWRQTEFD